MTTNAAVTPCRYQSLDEAIAGVEATMRALFGDINASWMLMSPGYENGEPRALYGFCLHSPISSVGGPMVWGYSDDAVEAQSGKEAKRQAIKLRRERGR